MCLSMTKTTTGNSLQQLSILLVLSVIMDMYLCYSCDKHNYMYSSNTWKYMYVRVHVPTSIYVYYAFKGKRL